MEIDDLEPGQHAPDDADCITVRAIPGGTFSFGGCIKLGNVVTSSLEQGRYDTMQQAREAGIAWAEEREVTHLFVQYDEA